jgi:hypothetical protein
VNAYRITHSASDYEFDHLITLACGGSPDRRHPWPEPDIGGPGAFIRNANDHVEADLHAVVCPGGRSLSAAQHMIAAN